MYINKTIYNYHFKLSKSILVIIFVATLVLVCISKYSTASSGVIYFVSPWGDDSATGKSESAALKSIQLALDLSKPGDSIHLLSGLYWQDIKTKHGGESGNPIAIVGNEKTILKGAGAHRIINIQHSYLNLSGFVIDGKISDSKYRKKLIYIKGTNPDFGITGIHVDNLSLKNAGEECLRLKYFAHHNEISNSKFENCGVYDFQLDRGKKNGEAIYIGTAPEQIRIDMNPTRDVDASNHNRIYKNHFLTNGNECVDIKEGSSYNIIEYNYCSEQKDPKSAGFSARGNNNIFRHNIVAKNLGAGIRLGGDSAADGLHNTVYNNKFHNNSEGAIKLLAWPQEKICGNLFKGNSKNVVGVYGDRINPESQCL